MFHQGTLVIMATNTFFFLFQGVFFNYSVRIYMSMANVNIHGQYSFRNYSLMNTWQLMSDIEK